MKLLYVVTAWPRYAEDIITPWLVRQVSELRVAGHEVDVLAPSYRGQPSFAGEHRFRYFPARWEDLTHDRPAMDKVKDVAGWLKLTGYVVCGCIEAAWLNGRKHYDVVHVHWPLPHIVFGHAARLTWPKTKIVATFYGSEFPMLRKSALLRFAMKELLWPCRVTAISTYTRDELFKLLRWIWADVIPYGAA